MNKNIKIAISNYIFPVGVTLVAGMAAGAALQNATLQEINDKQATQYRETLKKAPQSPVTSALRDISTLTHDEKDEATRQAIADEYLKMHKLAPEHELAVRSLLNHLSREAFNAFARDLRKAQLSSEVFQPQNERE